ncbi:MAG: signal recognition particle protein [Gammaproteobacteria bacterium]|nr:signal recognition particle protein [Gammaproteobacteria bacterium]
MFENLSQRLNSVVRNVTGRGRLTEENIQSAMRDVRMALLEADVALPVIKGFIEQVKTRALGAEVSESLNPGQSFIRIVNQELTQLMGEAATELNFTTRPPAVILLAGLQGAGKTTSAAKLARYLRDRLNKKVMLVSCDIYRPAAIEQLKTLAQSLDIAWSASHAGETPITIATRAIDEARKAFVDVLIVDTAGRLHIDNDMMDEIKTLHKAITPIETLFVVDSMTGQDAANTAKVFNDALPLTGVILTKLDGDARGGAALSIRYITGKPIKFVGMGEKTDALEIFHPDRMASRILGMGDVLSLIEQAGQQVDAAKAEKLAAKVKKGQGFDLNDLRDQLLMMENMGGMAALLDKLPGMGQLPEAARKQMDDKKNRRLIAMINSMTPIERKKPDIISGSRKRRIAAGSGTQIQDINRLLKQHKEMSTMMKKFSKGGMQGMMRSLQGKLPPGFLGK